MKIFDLKAPAVGRAIIGIPSATIIAIGVVIAVSFIIASKSETTQQAMADCRLRYSSTSQLLPKTSEEYSKLDDCMIAKGFKKAADCPTVSSSDVYFCWRHTTFPGLIADLMMEIF